MNLALKIVLGVLTPIAVLVWQTGKSINLTCDWVGPGMAECQTQEKRFYGLFTDEPSQPFRVNDVVIEPLAYRNAEGEAFTTNRLLLLTPIGQMEFNHYEDQTTARAEQNRILNFLNGSGEPRFEIDRRDSWGDVAFTLGAVVFGAIVLSAKF